MNDKNLSKYLEYLKYQKAYSNYTVDNYKSDIDEFFDFCNRESLSYLDIEYSDTRIYLMYLKEEKKHVELLKKINNLE